MTLFKECRMTILMKGGGAIYDATLSMGICEGKYENMRILDLIRAQKPLFVAQNCLILPK